MLALKTFVRNNTAGVAIFIYIIIFMIIQYINPSFLYNEDGSLREFGIGYSSKTILPIWLVAIIVAILSYLAVFVYSHTSRVALM
jgi:amino acid permease